MKKDTKHDTIVFASRSGGMFFLMNKINTNFFREVKDELKKVVWPSREETIRLTTIVITASIIVGLFIGGFDLLFAKIFSLVLKM